MRNDKFFAAGQREMLYAALKKLSERDQAFLDMVNCKENPLTREDLERAIARFPQRWERYKAFLPHLPTEASIIKGATDETE